MRRPVRMAGALMAMLIAGGAARADSANERLDGLIKPFKGTVVLYARNLDTGRDLAIGADAKVRTASTIKLPILCALAAEVARGHVKWDERLTVGAADKVGGTGVVRELADGSTLAVRDLATLMIVVSDNTATNLILDRISADIVNGYLDTVGLTETRALRKIRRSGALPAGEGLSRAGAIEANKRFGLGVSTPREMVRLLELLEQGKIVSPAASKEILDTLRRQQHKDGIGRRTRGLEVASKSGTLDALRSDVGIVVYTKAGRVAIAITVDDMPVTDYSADNVGSQLIAELALVLVEALTGVKVSPAS